MSWKNLKKQKMIYTNEVGDLKEFETVIQVESDSGDFRIRIPEFLINHVEESEHLKMEMYTYKSKYRYALGDSPEKLTKNLHKCLKEVMECEQIEREVLVIYFQGKGEFYKDSSGKLTHNAYSSKGKGVWYPKKPESTFTKDNFYGLKIRAGFYKEITYRRGSKEEKRYKIIEEGNSNLDTYSSFGLKINQFNSSGSFKIIETKYDYKTRSGELDPSENVKVLEYSEEVGKFFYDLIIASCRLVQVLEDYMEDKNLEKKILTGEAPKFLE